MSDIIARGDVVDAIARRVRSAVALECARFNRVTVAEVVMALSAVTSEGTQQLSLDGSRIYLA